MVEVAAGAAHKRPWFAAAAESAFAAGQALAAKRAGPEQIKDSEVAEPAAVAAELAEDTAAVASVSVEEAVASLPGRQLPAVQS